MKRGRLLRKSELSNVVFSFIFPVRKPLPRGLYGTKPIPRSSGRYNFLLGISCPDRVFALESSDRQNCSEEMFSALAKLVALELFASNLTCLKPVEAFASAVYLAR